MNKITGLVLCGLCVVFGNNIEISDGTRYHFTGLIDNKYPIFMTLALEEMDVTGTYYYYSIGTRIDLRGTYTRDGTFSINEFVDDECTGTFNGTFAVERTSASGTWTNTTGLKTMEFTLTQVARDMVIESRLYDVIAHIPQFTDEQPASQSMISDTINALFNDFLYSYEPDMKSFPEWGWAFDCDYTIEYYDESFLSILLEIYEHTGGAHGNMFFINLNCAGERDTTRLIELADLFVDGSAYGSLLSDILMQDLKKQKADYVLDGSIEEVKPELSVYVITPKGIQFIFAPYAVGPYACGSYTVTIPYKKIYHIIEKNGLLETFVK